MLEVVPWSVMLRNYVFQVMMPGRRANKLRGKKQMDQSNVSTFRIQTPICLLAWLNWELSWYISATYWVRFFQSGRFHSRFLLEFWVPDLWLIISKFNLPRDQQPVRANRRNIFWKTTPSVGSRLAEQTVSWTARDQEMSTKTPPVSEIVWPPPVLLSS